MARARKAGDTTHNARRRYIRKAERLVKQAITKVGSVKSRLLIQAQDLVSDAVSLYSSSDKIGSKVRNLAQSLGVDVDRAQPTKSKLDVIAESYEQLESYKIDEVAKKDRIAKRILSRGNIGSRFYGGLIDIWEGADPSERDELIKQAFGAESLLDVLKELENVTDLYKAPTNEERYNVAALRIAEYAASK